VRTAAERSLMADNAQEVVHAGPSTTATGVRVYV